MATDKERRAERNRQKRESKRQKRLKRKRYRNELKKQGRKERIIQAAKNTRAQIRVDALVIKSKKQRPPDCLPMKERL